MRRLPSRIASLPPALQLLPFFLAAAAMFVPCSCFLATSRRRGDMAARCVARRNSLVDDAQTVTEAYLLSVGFVDEDLRKARSHYGRSFDPDVDTKVKPILKWLSQLGLAELQIRKAVAGFSILLRLSLEENLKPTVQFLKDLAMDDMQVVKSSTSLPQLFGLSIEKNLEPKVQWLKDLGMKNQGQYRLSRSSLVTASTIIAIRSYVCFANGASRTARLWEFCRDFLSF
mmetsp:Transcript_176829/g.567190  ORF Transcript_176829/g.567190 Transcript_176829/m.567190 type:complete len:229 (+) Transcript_176829:151-837(+)